MDKIEAGQSFELFVEEDQGGLRLDAWLSEELGDDVSRSQIQKWMKLGLIQSEFRVKPSHSVSPGERYLVHVPEPVQQDLSPVEMEIETLFEDRDLAVIVKPPGIAVHPGPGDTSVTLINGLLHRWSEIDGVGETFRPGIVHRLDKPTEGILLVAKNERAHRLLATQFQERTIYKEYACWLNASPREEKGRIEAPIRRDSSDRLKMKVDPTGRTAVTDWEVQKSIISRKGRKFSFVKVVIHTGRTHQIRVHMAYIGASIVGDPQYSRNASRFEKFGMLLIARKIRFNHPSTGETMEFELDLPLRFSEFERKAPNY